MKINWRVRVKNKNFWLSIIPATLILIQTVAAAFGVTLDIGEIGSRLLSFVEAAFLLLALLGVVNDPTTDGFSDSEQALTYDKPKKDN